MSRSGYDEDCDTDYPVDFYRRAVENAARGKRGQKFLGELLAALDALPEKKLIAEDLVDERGCVCAIGAIGRQRGVDMTRLDPEDWDTPEWLAKQLGVAPSLVREVIYMNDEGAWARTPEERFVKMRTWVEKQIKPAGA